MLVTSALFWNRMDEQHPVLSSMRTTERKPAKRKKRTAKGGATPIELYLRGAKGFFQIPPLDGSISNWGCRNEGSLGHGVGERVCVNDYEEMRRALYQITTKE
jgi:hypothetical protein